MHAHVHTYVHERIFTQVRFVDVDALDTRALNVPQPDPTSDFAPPLGEAARLQNHQLASNADY